MKLFTNSFPMTKRPALIIPAVILGLIFLYVGYVYSSHTAMNLPHYFPGYDATLGSVHTKHAIAAYALGVILFIFAWFQGGKASGTAE